MFFAWAALYFALRPVESFATVADSVDSSKVSLTDTLRPVPWSIELWDGERFRIERLEDRELLLPLRSNSVGISALGSPDWVFSYGLLGFGGRVAEPFWANAVLGTPQDWNVRKGPLPVVDWIGQSAHGRGQEFGIVASASPQYDKHFWVDFHRLQMSGGLLTEDHFRDRLRTSFWGKAGKWNYNVQIGLQRSIDGESGGIIDVRQLTEANFWQPNRDLVTTRWSQAERFGRSSQVCMEWSHVQSRLGIVLNWSDNRSGFNGPDLISDSVNYSAFDFRVVRGEGARWSVPAMRGVGVIDVLPKVRSSWSVGVRLVNARYWENGLWFTPNQVPSWSPVASWDFPGHRNRFGADVDFMGRAVEFNYSRQRWLDFGSNPWLVVQGVQRWAMPWQGTAVSHVRSGMIKVIPWKQLAFCTQVSSRDPMLQVDDWSDVQATWVARSPWAMLGADAKGSVSLSRHWSMKGLVQGRWASARELGLAPVFSELALVYASKVPNLYPGMRVQFEVLGQGWSGGWQRPIWVAEKGLFGHALNGEAMPAGGLVHIAALVYLGEAQLGIVAQNANQGWIPNTVLVAQNYPVAPATLRWFFKWRMFE